MSDISSSYITQIVNVGLIGNTGPTGNEGPIGPTGNKGPTASNCSSGNTGQYLQSISMSNDSIGSTLIYILSPSGVSYSVSGAEIFTGATLLGNYGISGSNIGSVSLLQGISFTGSGITNQAIFNFKNIISATSGISVTFDSNFIYINATGGTYSSSSTINGLAYYNTLPNITTTNPNISGIGFTSDVYYGITKTYLHLNGISGSTNSVSVFTKKLNISPVLAGLNYLDLSLGGIFNIKTPYGFHGFTGIVGASGSTGTILSATLIIENDNIWNFPQNVFFRSDEAYLSCGTSVIGVYSTNNGATWNADFFGRGYNAGVDPVIGPCFPAKIMGSFTTYTASQVKIGCTDYIAFADSIITSLFDTFCPLQICSSTLGFCCIKGKCNEKVPQHLCLKYGGRFHGITSCTPSGFCFDPCGGGTTGSCCFGTTCENRYTQQECVSRGGTFKLGVSCTSTLCN